MALPLALLLALARVAAAILLRTAAPALAFAVASVPGFPTVLLAPAIRGKPVGSLAAMLRLDDGEGTGPEVTGNGLHLDQAYDVPIGEAITHPGAGTVMLLPIPPGPAIGRTGIPIDSHEEHRGTDVDLKEDVGPGIPLSPEVEDETRAPMGLVGQEGDDGEIVFRIGAALDERGGHRGPPGLVSHVQEDAGVLVDLHAHGHINADAGARRGARENQEHCRAEKNTLHVQPPFRNETPAI